MGGSKTFPHYPFQLVPDRHISEEVNGGLEVGLFPRDHQSADVEPERMPRLILSLHIVVLDRFPQSDHGCDMTAFIAEEIADGVTASENLATKSA
jgi:hypothetical protein